MLFSIKLSCAVVVCHVSVECTDAVVVCPVAVAVHLVAVHLVVVCLIGVVVCTNAVVVYLVAVPSRWEQAVETETVLISIHKKLNPESTSTFGRF